MRNKETIILFMGSCAVNNANVLLFPNSERHIEVLSSEFKIDNEKYLKISSSLAPWTGGSGRHREYLYLSKKLFK